MKNIWIKHRHRLFTDLVKRHGPFTPKNWNSIRPLNVTIDAWKKYLDEVALRVGATSGRAVENQIQWAVTKQPTLSGNQIGGWLLNKATAFEAGFISTEQLKESLANLGIALKDQSRSKGNKHEHEPIRAPLPRGNRAQARQRSLQTSA